jgi:hypothetical protein
MCLQFLHESCALTSNPADQLFPSAPLWGVLEFQTDLADVTKIRPAFDDQYIPFIFLSPKDVSREAVVVPFVNPTSHEVKVIVTAKNYVHAMFVGNVRGGLRRRR